MRSLLLLLTIGLTSFGCAQAESDANPGETGGTTADDLTGTQHRATFAGTRFGTVGVVPLALPPAMPGLPRYNVPVEGALAPWSWYAVETARATVSGGTIEFHYPFPAFITGEEHYVKLTGAFTPGQTHVDVTAEGVGQGTCDLANGIWSCHEQLPGLSVDVGVAKSTMQAAGLSSAQIAKRLAVSARFSSDPIGIFEMADADVQYDDCYGDVEGDGARDDD